MPFFSTRCVTVGVADAAAVAQAEAAEERDTAQHEAMVAQLEDAVATLATEQGNQPKRARRCSEEDLRPRFLVLTEEQGQELAALLAYKGTPPHRQTALRMHTGVCINNSH